MYFDTCVYHRPGMELLLKMIPEDNVLFASEIVGAVKGIDPETGYHYDDTKRYIDAIDWLTPTHRAKVYNGNACRVYPRLKAHLEKRGATKS